MNHSRYRALASQKKRLSFQKLRQFDKEQVLSTGSAQDWLGASYFAPTDLPVVDGFWMATIWKRPSSIATGGWAKLPVVSNALP